MVNFQTRKAFQISLGALIGLTAACSDVSFAPTDPLALKVGTMTEDSFVQGYTKNTLDVLFVVDNSNSMEEDQKKLGRRISSFLATLSDVDWQVAVTTTDASSGPYGIKGQLLAINDRGDTVITPKTPDYLNVFLRTVVRPESYECSIGGECPTGHEQALEATILAMEKRDSVNKGFFRPNANLSVIILSDEDEDAPSGAPTKPEEVISSFNSIWADQKYLSVYGMIIVPGDVSCLMSQGNSGKFGMSVDKLARLTGGIVGSICEADYGRALQKVGQNVRKLLDYVELRGTPDKGEVEVTFQPAHTTKYKVKNKRVYFEVPPPVGTAVKVRYKVGADLSD